MVGRPEAETRATDAATATTADRRDASGGRGGGGTNMSACEHFGWFTRVFTRGLVFEPGNWDTVSSIARRARENRTRIRFLTSGSPWQHPPRPSSLPWTSTTSTPSTTTATASSSGTNGFRSSRSHRRPCLVRAHIIYPRHMVLSQRKTRSSISPLPCSMTSKATTRSSGCKPCTLGPRS